jgi:hypothetical protein
VFLHALTLTTETNILIQQNSNVRLHVQVVIGEIQLIIFANLNVRVGTMETNTIQTGLVYRYALLLILDNIERLVEFVCQLVILATGLMVQQDFALMSKRNAQIQLMQTHRKSFV